MVKIFNSKQIRTKRKELRADISIPEQKFWYKIRNKQLGYKFRRQHSIGNYIVDFYCPTLNLIIEIDGDSHAISTNLKKEKTRTEYFENLNLKVIRYNNRDVLYNMNGVLENLENKIKEIESQTPSNSPLERGRRRGELPLSKGEKKRGASPF